jgi:hypothetical protein
VNCTYFLHDDEIFKTSDKSALFHLYMLIFLQYKMIKHEKGHWLSHTSNYHHYLPIQTVLTMVYFDCISTEWSLPKSQGIVKWPNCLQYSLDLKKPDFCIQRSNWNSYWDILSIIWNALWAWTTWRRSHFLSKMKVICFIGDLCWRQSISNLGSQLVSNNFNIDSYRYFTSGIKLLN